MAHGGKDSSGKQGSGRGGVARNSSSNHHSYHSGAQQAHLQHQNKMVSNSMNFGESTHHQQRGSHGGDGLGNMKLKLSKKQKSTTIEPPTAIHQGIGGASGHSAHHLDRQQQYERLGGNVPRQSQTAGGAVNSHQQKHSSQTRGGTAAGGGSTGHIKSASQHAN